jgi:DtxR family Mn-dependent transcriptional regulator
VLDHPTRSPYGNRIPGLAELGEPPAPADPEPVNLMRIVAGADGEVNATIRAIGEPLQVDTALLGRLRRAGIVPGNRGVFSLHGPGVIGTIDGVGEPIALPHELAAHIFVSVAATVR